VIFLFSIYRLVIGAYTQCRDNSVNMQKVKHKFRASHCCNNIVFRLTRIFAESLQQESVATEIVMEVPHLQASYESSQVDLCVYVSVC